MAITLELPHVGESVVEGTIGKWLKQPGDSIERYEPLVEVITDKVTMEVPSPVSGSLLRILAQEGETVPMGAAIAELETTEVPDTAAPAPAPVSAPTVTSHAGVASTTGYLVTDVKPVGPTGGGAGPESVSQPETTGATAPGGAARPSPAVRRLAGEHGVDLSQVQGTGLGGRITRDDLLRYVEDRGTPQAPPAAPQPAARPSAESGSPQLDSDEEHVPLTPIRRMIAEAMVRSVSQIPHAWSTIEVDVTSLVALRAQVRAAFEQSEGVDLTYLPFVIKAVVQSLKEHGTLNASWGGDKIILKKRINLGIAVAAPEGLFVPVIHDADALSIAGLAAAVRDLTMRARQNKLRLEDVQGGTFTLNNTGALGSIVSYPIINHPQAAILTTEVIQKRAVVRDDAIAIRSMMNLCMSFDHRINDGSQSAAFLQAVKSRLESMGPDTPIY
ncbi:MAG: 2-oxo acid dehydrogenase subunit E2 [Chloroflexi bacterium]|nr:2-oxo acid dehydrogenase subunit E2 [Chloroflexota bacterium]